MSKILNLYENFWDKNSIWTILGEADFKLHPFSNNIDTSDKADNNNPKTKIKSFSDFEKIDSSNSPIKMNFISNVVSKFSNFKSNKEATSKYLEVSKYINELMNQKNLDAQDIFGPSLISKEQFSKIRGAKNNRKPYIPSKNYFIKIALVMKLSFDEAFMLLTKAGYSFSPLCAEDKVYVFIFNELTSLKNCSANNIVSYVTELLSELNLPPLFEDIA